MYKNMKTYKEFINEGVRDKMTPKPMEDIKKELVGKPLIYVLYELRKNNIKLEDIFTKEEIDKMDNSFSYVDEENELIIVDPKRIKEIIRVGEGIDDLDVVSREQWYQGKKDYSNEVYVTFFDNAWGGIDLSEWNQLDKIMKELVKKNGITNYDIDTRNNSLTISFDYKYPLEEI